MADSDLLQTWRVFRKATAAVDHRLSAAVATLPVQPQLVEALALLVATPTGRLTMSRLATLLDVTTGGLTKISTVSCATTWSTGSRAAATAGWSSPC